MRCSGRSPDLFVKLIRTFSASVLIVSALTSCVAPAKVSEEKDANGNKIEYGYYTPTGSNVPIKVRKVQPKATNKDAAASEKELEEMQRTGSERIGTGPPQGPGGK